MLNKKWILLCYAILLSTFVAHASTLNNPYPRKQKTANTLYNTFTERPKTLDPARSYSSNEYVFLGQIYEPPLQYHYLKRPFKLIPLTATKLPTAEYYNAKGERLAASAPAKQVAYTLYNIKIKPGIYFAPHPALARESAGKYLYHNINENFLSNNKIDSLGDFAETGTRELTAADYVYQIKRLAHPKLQSPIFGLMSEYIVGLPGYGTLLAKAYKKQIAKDGKDSFFDLRKYPLEGVKQLDRYTYQIKVRGKYPQFLYWLAMPFFSPMPWEADLFSAQAGMQKRNISLDWYPIGTGAYFLAENNPNRQMVLKRNLHFHKEFYPADGSDKDKATGLLQDAGKRLPFVDRVEFKLEKESIPRWNKFLQGYYDASGISSDSFDQAIQVDEHGNPQLTPELEQRGIKLYTTVSPSIFYLGFNMLDNIVGGTSERARKLRQAISIALDYEEFVAIFFNGRGIVAHGPIPPGIYGFETGKAGINPIVYELVNGKLQRKSLDAAKKLLTEAGYPGGRDIKTGKPLVLNYDVPASSGPDDNARFDWMRKQFAKLGIQLHIRATQYNRFQQKMRNGNAQIFAWGWHADYPDPENFLFLLYGPNSKVKHGGENAANYNSQKYNELFEQVKNMQNTPERLDLIKQMIALVQNDSPWIWGFHPKTFQLSHEWNRVSKPNEISHNVLKYARLNPELRAEKRSEWNKPVLWPLFLILGLLVILILPVIIKYRKKERVPPELK